MVTETTREQSDIITRFREGKISQAEASAKVKSLRRRGGGAAQAEAARRAGEKEAARQAKIASEKAAERKRVADIRESGRQEIIQAGTIFGQLEQKGLNEQFGTRTDFGGDFDIFGDKRRLVLSSSGEAQLIAPPSKEDILVATFGLGGAVGDFIEPRVVKKGRRTTAPPSLFGQGTIVPEAPPIRDVFIPGGGRIKPPKVQPSGFDFGQGTQTDFGTQDFSGSQILTQPSIVKRKIDEIEGVPVFQDVFIDPTGNGRQKERLLIPGEAKALREAQQVLVIPEERPKTTLGGVEQFFEEKRQEVQSGRATGLGLFLGGIGAGAAASFIGSARFAGALVTDPIGTGVQFATSLKDIPQGLSTIGQLIRTEPGFVGGFLAGEASQAFVGGKVLKFAGRGLEVGRTRLDPRFRFIDDIGGGKTITGIPSQFDDAFSIKFAGSVDDIGIPISRQIKIAGTDVTAVSGARDFFTKFKTEVFVDKPLPSPSSPILEKSFFADPFGRARVSRLGVFDDVPTAKFTDILSGDVTFKKSRPQLIVFEGTPVQAFPKNLKNIEAKLARGGTLTASEEAKLLSFQTTPSGQFKPLGFLSTEPEITLAKGETIFKKDLLGVTLIGGRRVEIIGAGIRGADDILAQLGGKGFGLDDITDLGKGAGRQFDDILDSGSRATISSTLTPPKPFVSPSTFFSPVFAGSKSISGFDSGFDRPRRKPTRGRISPKTPSSDFFGSPSVSDFFPSPPSPTGNGRPSRGRRITAPPISSPFLSSPGFEDPLGQRRVPRRLSRKDKKKKLKDKKIRRRPIERIAPSLTGQVLFDLGGITGGPLKLSGPGGRSPGDIRFVPSDLVGFGGSDFSFGGFGSTARRRKSKVKKKK